MMMMMMTKIIRDKSNNIYITVYVHIMDEFHLKCCDFPSHFLASQEVVFC